MILLGIDPGSVKTGWGVIDVRGRSLVPLDWGVLRMPPKTPLPERLIKIHDGLMACLQDHRVEAAAVESIFQSGRQQNMQSILKLGHARGVILLALAQAGLPLTEYPPAEVKKSLVGHGRADKRQMKEMVRALLKLSKIPAEDAADALAVAICHGFRLQNPVLGGVTK